MQSFKIYRMETMKMPLIALIKEGKSDTLEFKLKLVLLFGLNISLSFDQLIDQPLLQNGPNFALIHAMSFHPFVVLLCLELHSREEEI